MRKDNSTCRFAVSQYDRLGWVIAEVLEIPDDCADKGCLGFVVALVPVSGFSVPTKSLPLVRAWRTDQPLSRHRGKVQQFWHGRRPPRKSGIGCRRRGGVARSRSSFQSSCIGIFRGQAFSSPRLVESQTSCSFGMTEENGEGRKGVRPRRSDVLSNDFFHQVSPITI